MTNDLAPTVTLTHGAAMPRVGLGTWPMDDGEVERAVRAAVEAGYRSFDTAENYRNEVGVGRGVRSCGLPREDLFVTTKFNAEWHGYDLAQRAFEAGAERLGLQYVDLLLIHWPNPGRDRYVDAWKGMAKLLDDGRVRAIGVSNFKPAHIDRLLDETGVTPDVNQIQLSPTVSRPAARQYHEKHGIVTESWGPIGQGDENLLTDAVIVELAERYARTPAQIILRWHLELGLVIVPKSASPQRMRENIDIFDFSLTADEVNRIGALDRGESAAVDSDQFGH
jgi:2,5-diketo-D-gluconate reductase A